MERNGGEGGGRGGWEMSRSGGKEAQMRRVGKVLTREGGEQKHGRE